MSETGRAGGGGGQVGNGELEPAAAAISGGSYGEDTVPGEANKVIKQAAETRFSNLSLPGPFSAPTDTERQLAKANLVCGVPVPAQGRLYEGGFAVQRQQLHDYG